MARSCNSWRVEAEELYLETCLRFIIGKKKEKWADDVQEEEEKEEEELFEESPSLFSSSQFESFSDDFLFSVTFCSRFLVLYCRNKLCLGYSRKESCLYVQMCAFIYAYVSVDGCVHVCVYI